MASHVLQRFLDLHADGLGQVSAEGRRTGVIDVGWLQSVYRKGRSEGLGSLSTDTWLPTSAITDAFTLNSLRQVKRGSSWA